MLFSKISTLLKVLAKIKFIQLSIIIHNYLFIGEFEFNLFASKVSVLIGIPYWVINYYYKAWTTRVLYLENTHFKTS